MTKSALEEVRRDLLKLDRGDLAVSEAEVLTKYREVRNAICLSDRETDALKRDVWEYAEKVMKDKGRPISPELTAVVERPKREGILMRAAAILR